MNMVCCNMFPALSIYMYTHTNTHTHIHTHIALTCCRQNAPATTHPSLDRHHPTSTASHSHTTNTYSNQANPPPSSATCLPLLSTPPTRTTINLRTRMSSSRRYQTVCISHLDSCTRKVVGRLLSKDYQHTAWWWPKMASDTLGSHLMALLLGPPTRQTAP
jgi:hypothetical protein